MDGREMTVDLHGPNDQSVPPNGFFWAGRSNPGNWVETDMNIGRYMTPTGWKGDKPICVGEDAVVRDGSVIFGQKVLTDEKIKLQGTVESFRMMMNAFRLSGVAMEGFFAFVGGVVPNDVFSSLREVFAPVGLFHEQYANHFFAGQNAKRSLIVYNETYHPKSLSVSWELRNGATGLKRGRESFFLSPGEIHRIPLSFTVPNFSKEQSLTLAAILSEGNQELKKINVSYPVYPARKKITIPQGTLAVFDPEKHTIHLLASLGVPFSELSDLKEMKNADVLVLGRDCFKADLPADQARTIKTFVEKGGKVICLEQKEFPRWLPVRVEMAKGRQATIGFLKDLNHPILKKLSADELKFWQEDNFIASSLYQKPVSDKFKVLVTAGSAESLTPLLEIPWGKGSYLLSQLSLIEKSQIEPVCLKLLEGLLSYAMSVQPGQPVTWDEKDMISFPLCQEKGFISADLRSLYNQNFQEEIATNKMMYSGWAVPKIKPVNDLPSGKQMFKGVPFDLANSAENNGKNCIALHAVASPYPFKPTPFIQDKAVVRIQGNFSHLYFLHALSYNWTSTDTGQYIVYYQDGKKETIPLTDGVNISSWPATPPRPLSHARPVWRGIVPGPEEATIYLADWENPFPEKTIEKVEFTLGKSTAIPVLIALTAKEIILQEK
jgi:hypothetical protein